MPPTLLMLWRRAVERSDCGLIVVALGSVAAGCSLDRSVHAVDDGQRSLLDAAGLDATAIDGADLDSRAPAPDAAALDADALDASSQDVGPPDVGAPDVGPPDVGPPDVGTPDTAPPSCDGEYGAAVGYILCQERATECEFASTLATVRTCGTTCLALGGRCIDAYRNEVPFPPCERQGTAIGCDVFHVDDICICTRGP